MSRKIRIETLLTDYFKPNLLSVVDESHQHHVPKNAETHFYVLVVSEQLNGLKRLDRHRLLNNLLSEEFNKGLHALTLHPYTPKEWQARKDTIPESPPCHDGFKHG